MITIIGWSYIQTDISTSNQISYFNFLLLSVSSSFINRLCSSASLLHVSITREIYRSDQSQRLTKNTRNSLNVDSIHNQSTACSVVFLACMLGESLFEVIADIVSTTEPLSCKPLYGYMSQSAVQCNTLYEVYLCVDNIKREGLFDI